MKLHILSDLHLEFGPFDLPDIERDVLILAGDTHVSRSLEKFLKRAAEKSPVIFIAGNHEFYHNEMCHKSKFFRSIRRPNIFFLDNGFVQINGFTFVGCTLWTDMNHKNPEIMKYIDSKMNDYHIIQLESNRFTPEDASSLHDFSVGYIKYCLTKFDPRKTVIITHHAPSFKSTSCWDSIDPIKYAYASDLNHFIEQTNPLLWIHGHVHCSYDYSIKETRIVCNARGYVPDALNPEFNPSFTVDL